MYSILELDKCLKTWSKTYLNALVRVRAQLCKPNQNLKEFVSTSIGAIKAFKKDCFFFPSTVQLLKYLSEPIGYLLAQHESFC